jgi:hypothetical protein
MLIRRASFVAVAVIAVASPVSAAVRKCGEIISSEVATAATEQDAKKKALDQWHDLALKLGAGFESWRLAADKSLKCFPKGSSFECVAFGRPCIVDQTPNSPPKLPDDKGQGI